MTLLLCMDDFTLELKRKSLPRMIDSLFTSSKSNHKMEPPKRSNKTTTFYGGFNITTRSSRFHALIIHCFGRNVPSGEGHQSLFSIISPNLLIMHQNVRRPLKIPIIVFKKLKRVSSPCFTDAFLLATSAGV